MNARRVTLIIAFALAAHSSTLATVLDSLMRGEVRVATHLREIDGSAVAALKHQFRDEHRLADRGAPFQSTDAFLRVTPPWRRLVVAAVSGDIWFIHYEHGGRGLHTHLVALARSAGSWRVVYSAWAFHAYDTLPKLREAIRSKKFSEETYEL